MRVPTHFAASPAEVLVASRPDIATSTEFGAIPRFLFDPRDAQVIDRVDTRPHQADWPVASHVCLCVAWIAQRRASFGLSPE
jgi:hypothetical protein